MLVVSSEMADAATIEAIVAAASMVVEEEEEREEAMAIMRTVELNPGPRVNSLRFNRMQKTTPSRNLTQGQALTMPISNTMLKYFNFC